MMMIMMMMMITWCYRLIMISVCVLFLPSRTWLQHPILHHTSSTSYVFTNSFNLIFSDVCCKVPCAGSSSSSSRASPRLERSRFHELPPSFSVLGSRHAELSPWLSGWRSAFRVRSQVWRGRPGRRLQSLGSPWVDLCRALKNDPTPKMWLGLLSNSWTFLHQSLYTYLPGSCSLMCWFCLQLLYIMTWACIAVLITVGQVLQQKEQITLNIFNIR